MITQCGEEQRFLVVQVVENQVAHGGRGLPENGPVGTVRHRHLAQGVKGGIELVVFDAERGESLGSLGSDGDDHRPQVVVFALVMVM